MQDVTTRQKEREQLLALNRKVTGIIAFVVGPLFVANLGWQAFLVPKWQFFALTGAMVLTFVLWARRVPGPPIGGECRRVGRFRTPPDNSRTAVSPESTRTRAAPASGHKTLTLRHRVC